MRISVSSSSRALIALFLSFSEVALALNSNGYGGYFGDTVDYANSSNSFILEKDLSAEEVQSNYHNGVYPKNSSFDSETTCELDKFLRTYTGQIKGINLNKEKCEYIINSGEMPLKISYNI